MTDTEKALYDTRDEYNRLAKEANDRMREAEKSGTYVEMVRAQAAWVAASAGARTIDKMMA